MIPGIAIGDVDVQSRGDFGRFGLPAGEALTTAHATADVMTASACSLLPAVRRAKLDPHLRSVVRTARSPTARRFAL